jgi:predicted aspartyl protease
MRKQKLFRLLLTACATLLVGSSPVISQKAPLLPGSEYDSVVRFPVEARGGQTLASRFGTHIIVQVSLNGSAPIELALDTGANYSTLNEDLAKKLKLKIRRGTYIGCPVTEYREARLSIGGIDVDNQRFCAILAKGVTTQTDGVKTKVPGILGYDFLRDFVVEIDYPKRIVKLYDPKSYKFVRGTDFAGEIPLHMKNGKPHVDVQILPRSDQPPIVIDALIDTGSGNNLLLLTSDVIPQIDRLVLCNFSF